MKAKTKEETNRTDSTVHLDGSAAAVQQCSWEGMIKVVYEGWQSGFCSVDKWTRRGQLGIPTCKSPFLVAFLQPNFISFLQCPSFFG